MASTRCICSAGHRITFVEMNTDTLNHDTRNHDTRNIGIESKHNVGNGSPRTPCTSNITGDTKVPSLGHGTASSAPSSLAPPRGTGTIDVVRGTI